MDANGIEERAETLEMTSLERRLEEIRDKRMKSAAEIRIAREWGSRTQTNRALVW